jgi:hypothetical protein
MVFYYLLGHLFDGQEKEHNILIEKLQTIENKIEDYIVSGDLDIALINANKLYLDDNWSSEETESWDSKREAYIRIIEIQIHERALTSPDTIFPPISSEDIVGNDYEDVVETFKEAGFTNIETVGIKDDTFIFSKSNEVEHIIINGKTDFTIEEYFSVNDKVIIYYYR